MMKKIEALDNLKRCFSEMPGIGEKTAQRLAFYVMNMTDPSVQELIRAIQTARTLTYCQTCFNFNMTELPAPSITSPIQVASSRPFGNESGCVICNDSQRDRNVICVVEQPSDLWALENSGVFRGLYHVLLGHIAHLENIGPEHLTINKLLERVHQNNILELILATNPTVEGDATALYIQKLLESTKIKVTRLARGIPSGSTIEYASKTILADALQGRKYFCH
ncbi:MAG: recombination mediator RecR [Planctomycetota bacterium]